VLDVARSLKIRESAIRRHLAQLERAGQVRSFSRQEGLGRPKKYVGLVARAVLSSPLSHSEE